MSVVIETAEVPQGGQQAFVGKTDLLVRGRRLASGLGRSVMVDPVVRGNVGACAHGKSAVVVHGRASFTVVDGGSDDGNLGASIVEVATRDDAYAHGESSIAVRKGGVSLSVVVASIRSARCVPGGLSVGAASKRLASCIPGDLSTGLASDRSARCAPGGLTPPLASPPLARSARDGPSAGVVPNHSTGQAGRGCCR